MVKSLAALALVAAAAACAPSARTSTPRTRGAAALARPLEVYQELGFIAGPAEFPVVASLATLAGPADSTYVLFALSMPNSALRFTRDGDGFSAQYKIALTFARDSVAVKQTERTEHVRIASFAETGRTDESIIFQEVVALAPGKYQIALSASDANSSRGFRTRDSLQVPSYDAPRTLGTPLLVYDVTPRSDRPSAPQLIANPRRTVPYGSDQPRVYLELYNAQVAEHVLLRVSDEQGQLLWQNEVAVVDGNERLRHALVDIPVGTLPLGRLRLHASVANANADTLHTPLLVTISDQWMVANFDEVLRFVDFIALPAEIDSLRSATGSERRAAWDRFWTRRDPLPATPINEFRDEFFQRVRFATENFAEAGRPGWDTDRGEVYIVLGPPDNETERSLGRDVGVEAHAVEWVYDSTPGGRLQLLFVDRTGFGRYELTPQSEHAFRTTAEKSRPRVR